MVQVDLYQINEVDMTRLNKFIGEMVSHRLLSKTAYVKRLQVVIKKLEKELKNENKVNTARTLKTKNLEPKLIDVSVSRSEENLSMIILDKELEIKDLRKNTKLPNDELAQTSEIIFMYEKIDRIENIYLKKKIS